MKKVFNITLLVLAAIISPIVAVAAYPDRALTMVVPFPPGGPTDIAGRVIGEALSQELGQTVVIENRPGASGSIGLSYAIRSKPDGYTVGALASPSLIAPFILEGTPYDLTQDIQPVGMAYYMPLVVLVNPEKTPKIEDMDTLVEYVNENASRGVNYTTAGIGSTAHLSMEMIRDEHGLDMLHIPYQGSAPGINALLAGDVDLMYSDYIAALPQIQSGKLKAIAINTNERLSDFPEVPTLIEQGFEAAKAVAWGGIVLPKEAPEDVVDILSSALQTVLQDESVQEKLHSVGAFAQYQGPKEMKETIKVDSNIWDNAIKEYNIKDE